MGDEVIPPPLLLAYGQVFTKLTCVCALSLIDVMSQKVIRQKSYPGFFDSPKSAKLCKFILSYNCATCVMCETRWCH